MTILKGDIEKIRENYGYSEPPEDTFSARQFAEESGLSEHSSKRYIRKAEADGLLKRVGMFSVNKTGRAMFFRMVKKGKK